MYHRSGTGGRTLPKKKKAEKNRELAYTVKNDKYNMKM